MLRGDQSWVRDILWSGRVKVLDKITNNGNTVLHVAVTTTELPGLLREVFTTKHTTIRFEKFRWKHATSCCCYYWEH